MFDLTESHLQALNYHGPVGLACDDTKLLPSFQPYYDSDQQCHVLLGHAGDILLLPEPSTFREAVENGIALKATKVCSQFFGIIIMTPIHDLSFACGHYKSHSLKYPPLSWLPNLLVTLWTSPNSSQCYGRLSKGLLTKALRYVAMLLMEVLWSIQCKSSS